MYFYDISLFRNFHFHVKAARIAQSGLSLGHGLEGPRYESQQGHVIFLFSETSKPFLGANPASYLMGTWLKRPRCEVDHSVPYSAELTN